MSFRLFLVRFGSVSGVDSAVFLSSSSPSLLGSFYWSCVPNAPSPTSYIDLRATGPPGLVFSRFPLFFMENTARSVLLIGRTGLGRGGGAA